MICTQHRDRRSSRHSRRRPRWRRVRTHGGCRPWTRMDTGRAVVHGLDRHHRPECRQEAWFTFKIVTPYADARRHRSNGTHLNSGNVLFRWTAVDQAAQYPMGRLSDRRICSAAGTISQRTVMNAWSPIGVIRQTGRGTGGCSPSMPQATSWRPRRRGSLVKDATAPTVTALTRRHRSPSTVRWQRRSANRCSVCDVIARDPVSLPQGDTSPGCQVRLRLAAPSAHMDAH